MRTRARQPGVDRIAALAGQPTDLVSLWHSATEVIAKFVPHYMTPCWYTVDPASLLITSHVQEGLTEFPADWLAGEYYNETSTRSTTCCAQRLASARCTRLQAAIPLAPGVGNAT